MSSTGQPEADRRKQRLAAALRDNLKRRKAQARERRADEGASRNAAPTADRRAPDTPKKP